MREQLSQRAGERLELILPYTAQGGRRGELKLGGLTETISLFCVVLNERDMIIVFHSLFSLQLDL